MPATILKNATVVNEGVIFETDLLIKQQRIAKIGKDISIPNAKVIDLQGNFLLPGVIDDQVHFREPGLTHKGNLFTESRAAIAGGITSFMEQPNTNPQTTTLEAHEAKFAMAAQSAFANYSFKFGGTNDNLEAIKRLDKNSCSGVKLFLGSSTGNMLVDDDAVLESIFKSTEMVISTHCEDENTIKNNLAHYSDIYGDDIPIALHPKIRSAEACYLSSSKAIALAKKTNARLHVFHLSTAKEMALFTNAIPLQEKRITAEVCVHHLWFSESDYKEKGTHIKWNPAVKTAEDRSALWEALLDDRIDVIATDHAPHTLQEKNQVYTKAPSGGPLVQHALVAMLQKHKAHQISLEQLVQKMCHNPAILFDVAARGFIREGYFADMVEIDLNAPWQVQKPNILYKCGWSPFEGTSFDAQVVRTFVNGHLAYNQGSLSDTSHAMRLTFDR
ncbi:MAG: dihydroorotase [Bacteroidota bacterium]